MIALIYTMFGMNKRTAMRFTIEAVNSMERATEVVLKPVGEMLNFKPGQFAFVEIQGKEWSEPHPFTISSAPNEDRLRLTMKVLGDWTRKVREELHPGGEVIVRGPYGRFDASTAECRKQVWIAGGIGLTPFLSKLRAMDEKDDRDIQLEIKKCTYRMYFRNLKWNHLRAQPAGKFSTFYIYQVRRNRVRWIMSIELISHF